MEVERSQQGEKILKHQCQVSVKTSRHQMIDFLEKREVIQMKKVAFKEVDQGLDLKQRSLRAASIFIFRRVNNLLKQTLHPKNICL